jgi:hypothetical protein
VAGDAWAEATPSPIRSNLRFVLSHRVFVLFKTNLTPPGSDTGTAREDAAEAKERHEVERV